MKKTISICLSLAMVLIMGVSSFATSNNFTKSPSVNPSPDTEFEWVDGASGGSIEVLSYGERNELSDTEKEIFEDAYESIVDSDDLGDILPEDLDVDSEDLGVSDLFYINREGEISGKVNVTITPETIENFVGVLQYVDGAWVDVEATVTDGGKIVIPMDDEGAIAIVVNTNIEAPGTSDNTMTYVLICIMAVSVVAVVIILVTSKKKSK